MRHVLLLFSSIVFLACRQRTIETETLQTKNLDKHSEKLEKSIVDSLKKGKSEYIDWASIRINGELPPICKGEDLIKLLGQPDSIISPQDFCVSYYNKDFRYAYFSNSQFEIYNDSAVVRSINFEKKPRVELKTQNLTLNNNTQLSELKIFFPNAVKNKEEIDVYGFGKMVTIRLAISKQETGDAWLLFFKNDKLIRMDYWMPC